MAVQLSTSVRNARLDTIESTIGTSASLFLYTGTQPASCAEANSGSLLATIELPSDWMGAASSGSKQKSGTWSVTATGSGTAAHFRLGSSASCQMQGSVGQGSGDLSLDNAVIATGQTVTVTTFTLTDGNA